MVSAGVVLNERQASPVPDATFSAVLRLGKVTLIAEKKKDVDRHYANCITFIIAYGDFGLSY